MSMFLGPIHYMMFNKIKISADRARAVIEAFKSKHPEGTEEAVKAALPEGPVDFGDKKLDELLGDAPIHSFLQSLIEKVETAEAKLVTALLYSFPDDGEKVLAEAFRTHGMETAKGALNGNPGSEDRFGTFERLMAELYLEGMPCDQVSSYNLIDEGTLEVEHSDCLHKTNWENAGAPIATMCELMDKWVEGCAEAVSPDMKLERITSVAKGSNSCSCRLIS